ncbi:carbohydrate ABC transporter permease [Microlunatus parietis]|uniref:Multiple sugar transport system permease protein n=1 Tax=Microlunatus parietis TaxID=682979 RepID=A0A7Y9I355_9ACTN|nr:carbohydrate ABC transporter permease [Microlunatus parietis]NYE69267.1 multiple sugar transport system permease protein [Microlunatus parietis]
MTATDLSIRAVSAIEETGPNRRPFRPSMIVLHLLLIFFGLLMAMPFVWMLLSSFKPLEEIFRVPPLLFPEAWTSENYAAAVEGANFLQGFGNSVLVAVTVTVVSLITCCMAAYAFARLRFPGREVLFLVFLATMMVPQQLTIIPLYVIMGQLRLVDTLWALILPAALFNAFGVFLMRQYVRGIPLELEEAAAIDGAGRIRIFVTIVLPLLRTPMVALGIFIFLGQWNSFFYPLIFLNTESNYTLPLLVNQFKGAYSSDWGALMAAVTIAAAPLLIVFVIAQRQIVEGIALSGSKT